MPVFNRSVSSNRLQIGLRINCKVAMSSNDEYGASDTDSEPETRHYRPLNSGNSLVGMSQASPSPPLIHTHLIHAHLSPGVSGDHRDPTSGTPLTMRTSTHSARGLTTLLPWGSPQRLEQWKQRRTKLGCITCGGKAGPSMARCLCEGPASEVLEL